MSGAVEGADKASLSKDDANAQRGQILFYGVLSFPRITVLKIVNLAQQVSGLISDAIFSSHYPLGSRLPTEEKLSFEFGVSRSVVREAIARMKSDGLVTTRQGLGAFVTESFGHLPFRIEGRPDDSKKQVLEVFELRMAVEAEAAALAAERATGHQLEEIGRALVSVNAMAHSDKVGVDEDMRFHRLIALAANNGLYDKFITFLEFHIRDQLIVSRGKSKAKGRLAGINHEHDAIYEAIRSHDSDAARKAVHAHLRSGLSAWFISGSARTVATLEFDSWSVFQDWLVTSHQAESKWA